VIQVIDAKRDKEDCQLGAEARKMETPRKLNHLNIEALNRCNPTVL
jgi:hypothetical protein